MISWHQPCRHQQENLKNQELKHLFHLLLEGKLRITTDVKFKILLAYIDHISANLHILYELYNISVSAVRQVQYSHVLLKSLKHVFSHLIQDFLLAMALRVIMCQFVAKKKKLNWPSDTTKMPRDQGHLVPTNKVVFVIIAHWLKIVHLLKT